jgi:SAM-dependent methyltransferase
VLSWGSLEHIVGGYARALAEIRRVLKPGGLFFVHPGLFYSDEGSHLGEFPFARAESHMHLKLERDELRRRVLAEAPQYIDRSGEFSSPEQYWQWHTELNPITVASSRSSGRSTSSPGGSRCAPPTASITRRPCKNTRSSTCR